MHPERKPLLQKARGTQQSIIGFRGEKVCPRCDPPEDRSPGWMSATLDRERGGRRQKVEKVSDLDYDGQDHRPSAQPLVDELGEVVVEHLLDQLDCMDVVVGGAVE